MTTEEARRAYSVVKPGQTMQQVIASIGEPMKTDETGRAYWRDSRNPGNYVELQVDFSPSGIVTGTRILSQSQTGGRENTLDPYEPKGNYRDRKN